MIQKIKKRFLAFSAVVLLVAPMVASPAVYAVDPLVQKSLCQGAQELKFADPAGANCDTTTTENSLNDTIATVINILSIIVGVIAVIMIIIGGFRYITSGGDSTKVGAAKNTILYALIGLIIVAVAQIIVRFVLNKATSIT